MTPEIANVLNDVGFATFLPRFISERVDVNVILEASDHDLILLGINTDAD